MVALTRRACMAGVTDCDLDRYRTGLYCIGIEITRSQGEACPWNPSSNSLDGHPRRRSATSPTAPSPTRRSSRSVRAGGSDGTSAPRSAVPWPADDGYGAMARVTLQTIADRLGVSRMTVSNAFSRPDQLSAELRERILAEARELGYVGPDPAARALARGTTGAIGVLLTDSLPYAFTDEVSVGFLGAVVDGLAPTGLALTLLTAGRARRRRPRPRRRHRRRARVLVPPRLASTGLAAPPQAPPGVRRPGADGGDLQRQRRRPRRGARRGPAPRRARSPPHRHRQHRRRRRTSGSSTTPSPPPVAIRRGSACSAGSTGWPGIVPTVVQTERGTRRRHHGRGPCSPWSPGRPPCSASPTCTPSGSSGWRGASA